jgi:hypothetical protein
MPLLIKTYVSKSKIEGLGLFSNQFVGKGEVVWKHDIVLDGFISEEDFEANSNNNALSDHFNHFLCYDKNIGSFIRACDNVNWINHSNNPNLDSPNKYIHYANKDIHQNEELTLNYNQICDRVEFGFNKNYH